MTRQIKKKPSKKAFSLFSHFSQSAEQRQRRRRGTIHQFLAETNNSSRAHRSYYRNPWGIFFPVKPQWSFGNRWEEKNVRRDWQLSPALDSAAPVCTVVSRREINHQIIFACLLHPDFWVARQLKWFFCFAEKSLPTSAVKSSSSATSQTEKSFLLLCYLLASLCWVICRDVREGQ